MIDVHPPHNAANSWRDFFVHIATIVVGLLIAIGLEQCVELLHQHHEARHTQEALRLEREGNRNRILKETWFWRRNTAALQNNLLVLRYIQQHPGTPQDKLPGVLFWSISTMVFSHSVWDSAQQTGEVKLLPHEEVGEDAFLYLELQRIETADSAVWLAVNQAEQYNLVDPDPTHLTPPQLAEVIDRTEKALTQQLLAGEALANLNGFTDLPQTVTRDEILSLRGLTNQQATGPLSAAYALTHDRLVAANPSQPDLPSTPSSKK